MAQVRYSLTVSLDVTAAPLQHPGNLSIDGVQAELGLGPPVPSRAAAAAATRRLLQLQFGWVRELQCLQQARLTLYKVGDGVHRQTTLQGEHRTINMSCNSLRFTVFPGGE